MANCYVNIDRATPRLLPPDLRGLAKVSLEWTLVTLAYNFKCLHYLRTVRRKA